VQDRIVRRLGIFALGLLLSRFIPNRTARRLAMLTIVPAIVTFLMQRGREFRRPRPNAV
jgi:hypothetical protein